MTRSNFILRNLFRHPLRTSLTLFSLFVAFLLYVVLGSVAAIFAVEVDTGGANRLITQAKYSIIDSLPAKYEREILALEGVEQIAGATWFGGYFQEPINQMAAFPVNPVQYFEVFSDLNISDEHLQAFIDTKTGCVVDVAMAEKFGWEVGDIIPMKTDIYEQKDGSLGWEFLLVGTYRPENANTGEGPFLFRYDYFEEASFFGQGYHGWYTMTITDPNAGPDIAQRIDAMYENSPDPTRTGSESEFAKGFLNQIGNITLMMSGILGAVFFTILLLTANTMSHNFRERIPELAVLKTLGYSDYAVGSFVLLEAIVLCVIPALFGMGLGYAVIAGGVIGALAGGMFLPPIPLEVLNYTVATGLGVAVGLGILVGIVPAITAKFLSIADALARR